MTSPPWEWIESQQHRVDESRLKSIRKAKDLHHQLNITNEAAWKKAKEEEQCALEKAAKCAWEKEEKKRRIHINLMATHRNELAAEEDTCRHRVFGEERFAWTALMLAWSRSGQEDDVLYQAEFVERLRKAHEGLLKFRV